MRLFKDDPKVGDTVNVKTWTRKGKRTQDGHTGVVIRQWPNTQIEVLFEDGIKLDVWPENIEVVK